MSYANDELRNKLFNTSPFNLPSRICGYRAGLDSYVIDSEYDYDPVWAKWPVWLYI